MKSEMKYAVSALLLFVILCSCSRGSEKKEPVSFDIKTFRVESQGGCKSDTLQCAYFEVTYPEFSGLDTGVVSRIREKVDAAVSLGNPESQGQSMREIGEIFIKDYDDFKSEIPESFGGWHYTAKVNVEVLTDTLISMSVNDEYYTGGAHGGSGVYFINLNPKTGAEFTLDDFLKPDYQDALTNLGNRIFRETRELADTASLSDNYFEFPEDQFELNKNYGFKKEGIAFFYNNYEIAPYAAGPTEVLIPYEDISEWIKE
jgi:Protein of unknown function (DUF3298)/Deacetylase PdaC